MKNCLCVWGSPIKTSICLMSAGGVLLPHCASQISPNLAQHIAVIQQICRNINWAVLSCAFHGRRRKTYSDYICRIFFVLILTGWSSEDICKITWTVIYVGKLKKLVPPCALPLATRFYQETEKTGGNAEDDSSSRGGHAALLRQPALTSSLLPSGRPLKRQRCHTKK